MSSTPTTILLTQSGPIATITLNRPELLNSFTLAMAQEFLGGLEKLDGDSAVRAVILTGAGRAFCAGQDLSEVQPRPDGTMPELGPIVRDCYNPIIKQLRTLQKPVIAAVNGVAAGAGANLALACDIVIAANEASFIQSFAHVGLIPDSGGTFFLPRLIGLGRATALTMLAEKVGAEEAAKMGMIYRAVPGAELIKEVTLVAQKLAALPTRGLAFTKALFNASFGNDLDDQLHLEEEYQALAGKTDDYREGVSAFVAKRKPVFRGQ